MRYYKRRLYKTKKADLSLSINAIVILILAITMLGLGLGFIKGMFGKVSTGFDEDISKIRDPTPATESNLLTLSSEKFIVEQGGTKSLKISAFCRLTGICDEPTVTFTCKEITSGKVVLPTGGKSKSIAPNFGKIPSLNSKISLAQIQVAADAGAGTTICTVDAAAGELDVGAASVQFFLEVK